MQRISKHHISCHTQLHAVTTFPRARLSQAVEIVSGGDFITACFPRRGSDARPCGILENQHSQLIYTSEHVLLVWYPMLGVRTCRMGVTTKLATRSGAAGLHPRPCLGSKRNRYVAMHASAGAEQAGANVARAELFRQDGAPGASPLAPALGLVLQLSGPQPLQSWPPALLLQWTRACAATGYRIPSTAAPALLTALLEAAPSLHGKAALQLLAALDTLDLTSKLQQHATATTKPSSLASAGPGSSSTGVLEGLAASTEQQPQQQQEAGDAGPASGDNSHLLTCWLRLLQTLYVNSMGVGQTVDPRGVDRATALALAAAMQGAAHAAASAAAAGAAAAVQEAAAAADPMSQLAVTPGSNSSGVIVLDDLVAQPAAGLPFLGPSAAPTGVVVESWCAALVAGEGAGLQQLPAKKLVAVATSLHTLLQLQQPGNPLEFALHWVQGLPAAGSSSSEPVLPPGFLACYCRVVAEKLPYIPVDELQQLAAALPQLLQRYERCQPLRSPSSLLFEQLSAAPAAGDPAGSQALGDTSSSSDSPVEAASTTTSGFATASQEAVACRQVLVAALQQHLPSLSSLQLCELLPLVVAADCAMPGDWVTQVTQRLAAGLSTLGCAGASRALLALMELQSPPPAEWCRQYVGLLRTGFLELSPEQLVSVLRALRTLDALPGSEWLQEVADSVSRRWGFIGPVELVRSGFVLANLGHMVGPAWGEQFLSETLRFAEYYSGEMVTHVVWCVVRLRLQPNAAWLQAYGQQLRAQVGGFLPYQLAFSLGSLQQLGAPLDGPTIDAALAAFAQQLGAASPADAVLMLVTVARLRHICSYSWLQSVLDYLQPRLGQLNGQEAVTVAWSLVQLHHTAEPEFMERLLEVASEQMLTMTSTQAAELLYCAALLDAAPDQQWLKRWCEVFQSALRAGLATGRDVASALSSLAALGHTPSDTWLQDALQLLHFRLRDLDAAGMASVPRSLVKLNVTLLAGPWLENFTSMLIPTLPRLSGSDKADLITCFATWGTCPPPAWLAAFQLSCVASAEAGGMTPLELEQVVVSVCSLGAAPSAALLQLWYETSSSHLTGWAPERLVNILAALRKAEVLPGSSWLQQVVAQVQGGLGGYSLTQLNSLLKSLLAFQAAGAAQPPLNNLISYLKEFFLYG